MKSRCLYILPALLFFTPSYAQIDESTVEAIVKNHTCLAEQTVESVLASKIKTGSQRDLGWQVYHEGEHFEVERAFLMNKSMQLRYRWQVNQDESISPIGKRAETLCVQE
jgi:hypothetical protein